MRVGVVAAAGVLAVVGLAGCEPRQNEFAEERTERARITTVAVQGGSGNVTVRAENRTDVHVRRTVRYSNDPPGATHRVDGATLRLDTDCGRWCSVDYLVTVPTAVGVTGENGSGDLTVTGASTVTFTVGSGQVTVTGVPGRVEVETGSGDVIVRGSGGELVARSKSGAIEVRSARGARTDLRTSSGDITVELATAGDLSAEASSGDVDVTVPAGRYQVRTEANGDVDVGGVTSDPASPHTLDLHASSGNVTLRQR